VQLNSEVFEDLAEAAVAVEMADDPTESPAEAKAHVLVRAVRMTVGFVVLLLGLAMMVLPGPGFLAVAGGLFILAPDIAWADRLLQHMRKRIPGIPEDGKIPRGQMATMAVMGLGAAAASVWYFNGGQAVLAGWWNNLF